MQDSTDTTDSTSTETGNNVKPEKVSSLESDIASIDMPEVGQRIGPNRILELVAEGGMANVYKVWHEGLEVVRAIKILKPGFNEETKQRLHTEAKISAHLHHPNIVEIYSVNFWKDAVPYIEMEYIDGFSLKDLLKYQKKAHFTFAVSIAYFVCNALNYAHNQVFTLYGKTYQGVVHRDIKPANILISRSGIVKLADFGIAKPSEISIHTVGQKVMGTFSYLCPEQLNGDPLDYRCDIYSLGTVIYEIITGVKAYPQKIMSELIQKKMLNEYRSVNDFGADIPRQLCAIINKCMELRKEKRYSTAPELAEALTCFLKKFTSRTPEQLVSEFLKNPKSAPAINRKPLINAPVMITASIMLFISLFFLTLTLFPELGKNIKYMVSYSLTAAASPDIKKFSQPQKSETQSLPEVATTAINTGNKTSNAPGVDDKKRNSAPLNVNPLKSGLNSVRLKRFREAIPLLEEALGKDLNDLQRSDCTVHLLESYLSTGDAAGALRLVNSKFINDGYFYLLCGRTYVLFGKFDKAIEAFGNAQTIPSRYNDNTLREATFLWAQTLDSIYKLKPNSENKRACLHAWQQFTKAFCDEGSAEQCRTAQERIIELNP